MTLDVVIELMDSRYTLNYVDRSNNLDNSIEVLTECLKSRNRDALNDHIYDWFSACEDDAVVAIIDALKAECAELGYCEDDIEELFELTDDEIRIAIHDRDDSNVVDEVIGNTDSLPVRIERYSNYDCINSHHFEGSYSYAESYFGDMVDALCLNPAKVKTIFEQNEVACSGDFPDREERNGLEVVSYEDFAIEISNSVTPANLLTFLAKVDISELYEREFDIEVITIPKGNYCGLYSASQGGGSLVGMKMQRDLTIKITAEGYDYFSMIFDGDTDCGYSFEDTYGIIKSYFGKAVTIAEHNTEE